MSDVARQLESAGQNLEKDNDEDNAILAFSNTLPGNDDEPKFIEIDADTKKKEAVAMLELDELNSNEATSAFGVLAQA